MVKASTLKLGFLVALLITASGTWTGTEARVDPSKCQRDQDCVGACDPRCQQCLCVPKPGPGCTCGNFQKNFIPKSINE
ncbi:hypothetical protein WN943_010257 [Citrus x changshan-huyou]